MRCVVFARFATAPALLPTEERGADCCADTAPSCLAAPASDYYDTDVFPV